MAVGSSQSASPTSKLAASISEDDLIRGLLDAQGQLVELIAFGIAYTGTLRTVNVEQGFVTVADEENQATLEFERIEGFRPLKARG